MNLTQLKDKAKGVVSSKYAGHILAVIMAVIILIVLLGGAEKQTEEVDEGNQPDATQEASPKEQPESGEQTGENPGGQTESGNPVGDAYDKHGGDVTSDDYASIVAILPKETVDTFFRDFAKAWTDLHTEDRENGKLYLGIGSPEACATGRMGGIDTNLSFIAQRLVDTVVIDCVNSYFNILAHGKHSSDLDRMYGEKLLAIQLCYQSSKLCYKRVNLAAIQQISKRPFCESSPGIWEFASACKEK